MDISARLQELRKERGYSQEQVAEILGLSRQAVSKWESGQGMPDIENLVKLAGVYHVSTDYILLGSEKQPEASASPKKEWFAEYKKVIGIIAIIAATAAITVLFVLGLKLMEICLYGR